MVDGLIVTTFLQQEGVRKVMVDNQHGSLAY
jgi:hypothetical protein